jgi:hypothetical protein
MSGFGPAFRWLPVIGKHNDSAPDRFRRVGAAELRFMTSHQGTEPEMKKPSNISMTSYA